jgi:transcriptional regulator with XRE-family HTH domain
MPGQGAQLKAIRLDLGFKTRDVERLSREIADTKGNSEFYISHGWLTQIENSELTPSIYKLYSLSAIYRLKYAQLLDLYGISLDDLGKDQIRIAVPRTHLLDLEPPSVENKIEFPVSLSPGLSLGETNLLGKMVESWGQVPVELIRTLDLRRVTYGYIGSEDRTMYPLIRPGSFVEIDERLRKIDSTPSIVENDRPIYFFGASQRLRMRVVRSKWIAAQPDSASKFSAENQAVCVSRRCDCAWPGRGSGDAAGRFCTRSEELDLPAWLRNL